MAERLGSYHAEDFGPIKFPLPRSSPACDVLLPNRSGTSFVAKGHGSGKPLSDHGDVTVPEWPAGPRREEHARKRNARKGAKNPPGPGGPLWHGNQLLVEKKQLDFPRYAGKKRLTALGEGAYGFVHIPFDPDSRCRRTTREPDLPQDERLTSRP